MTPTLQKKPAFHAIAIRFDGKGFVYTTADQKDGATIAVRRGDRVKWSSDLGNYSILFKGESPFVEVATHGRKGAETDLLEIVGEPGAYKYAVTVAHANGLTVDDPVVIVSGDGDGI